MNCIFCGEAIVTTDRIGRNDTCPNCDRDLRCCKQCEFYDTHAYNECREVSAERIVDKERANFCEFFIPKGSHQGKIDRTKEAKRALEALFKK